MLTLPGIANNQPEVQRGTAFDSVVQFLVTKRINSVAFVIQGFKADTAIMSR